MKKKLGIALFILAIINIIQIFGIELSHDEAYYWLYSQNMDWGYYDHPPMVALFIKIGTFFFGDNEFGVRILFNVATILSLWLAFRMSKHKNTLLFTTLLFSFPLIQASGFLALPDTCLLFFSTLFFYFLKKYLNEDKMIWAAFLSLSIAGMLYSKYHAGLIIILTLVALPALFKKKSFYFIALSSLLLYTPHLYWQFQHDFVTFKFHLFKRTEKHFDFLNVLDYLAGQVVLSGFVAAFILYYNLIKYKTTSQFERVLKFQILGFLIFLFFMSFRNKIEANWTLTIFIPLLILSGKMIKKVKPLVLAAVPLAIIIFVLRALMIFPHSKIPIKRVTEFHGWQETAEEMLRSCNQETYAANSYQLASKMSFYSKKTIPALHINGRKSQYSLLEAQNFGDQKICYLTFNKVENSKIIKRSYPSDVRFIEASLEEIQALEK